jgi:serine/threonine protein kinase
MEPAPFPPDCRGKFRLIRPLAVGGFAEVHEAVHKELGTRVAIKVLHAGLVNDPEQVQRFLNEARCTAQLSHPNIVRVIDAGVSDFPWIAFEFMDGPSLRTLLDRNPGGLDVANAIQISIQVLAGLTEAHGAGLIHRDIKPENILEAEPGRYTVADFGIAKWSGADAVQTRTGVVLGTVGYLAPEIVDGAPASVQTDLYAVGVLLFELVTGQLPYWDSNPIVLLEHHRSQPTPRASSRRPGIPAALDALILQAISKDPAARPLAANRMRAALEQITPEFVSTPTLATTLTRRTGKMHHRGKSRSTPRNRSTMSYLGPVLAVGVVVLWLMVSRFHVPPVETPSALPSHAHNEKSILFTTYQAVEKYHDALMARGSAAKEAIQRLQSETRLKLGDNPATWLNWGRLSREVWLCRDLAAIDEQLQEDARRVDAHEANYFLRALRESTGTAAPRVLTEVVRGLCYFPKDPCWWFALGFVADQAGLHQQARGVFRYAREVWRTRLPRSPNNSSYSWAGVFRSVMHERGDVVKIWDAVVQPWEHESDPYEGLEMAMARHRKEQFRVLERLVQVRPNPAMAANFLGAAYLRNDEASQARRVWTDFLKAHPTDARVLGNLISYHLQHGFLDEARRLMVMHPELARWRRLVRLMGDPPDLKSPLADEEVTPLLMLILRRLEAHQAGDALGFLHKARPDDRRLPRWAQAAIGLELYGAGIRQPWLDARLRDWVADPVWEPTFPGTFACIRHFSYPACAELMQLYLRSIKPARAGAADAIRHVSQGAWNSRLGRIQDSLNDLPGPQALKDASSWWGGYAEVLCRAHWWEARGLCPPLKWPALPPAYAAFTPKGVGALLDAVREKDFRRSSVEAKDLVANRTDCLDWVMPAVMLCDLAQDRAGLRDLLARAPTIVRSHKAGLQMLKELEEIRARLGAGL